jgi:hypothetical protein
MDLRDRFAAHFAAALVDALAVPGEIARRAYDLAEAMMVERSRRVSMEDEPMEDEPMEDERAAIQDEPHLAWLPPPAPPLYHPALLDEPEPPFDMDADYDDELDPRWMEPPYDPSWDLETRWSGEAPSSQPAVQGPGLARTRPEAEEQPRKEKLA